MTMTMASGSAAYSAKLYLKAGDVIDGDASVATVVDYSLHGFEREA